ncbi:unnamed protein product [Caenorhabditis angaria]|uniref:Ubiquitin carboxyl-terminal hydrolase n=1 Tax=Caenorhabditis angaria TaxID=860376 RepID=A0A9P1N0G2_9PELO|nr:unnamed protein product [Caenorhabditis angaria]
MASLRERVFHELNLKPEVNIKIYVVNGENWELVDTTQSIDSYFDTAQKICIDTEQDGEFFYKKPPQAPATKSLFGPSNSIGNGSYSGYSGGGTSASSGGVPPGQCGLQNLGNTCFMASALQCLSNMPQLREYFLSDEYLNDLNEENPLGTHGNLAQAVGELFKSMWNGQFGSVSPRRFKAIIGQFAPRFNGYSQQDSHELMAYVLDGLHEDLNRIKKKPYFEDNDELAKLPLHEYAQKSWEMYKMRNDSIIVDTLHGQLKSTLICPVCAKISIKFDPFGYISLPLPPKEQISRQTVIIMFFKRKWAKFSFTLTENTTVAEAEELMRAKLQFEEERHFVFFYCQPVSDEVVLLRPNDTIRQSMGREVFVAEVLHDPHAPGTRIVVGFNRFKINRQCSLPMIYTLKSGEELTRKFVFDTILETTKHLFFHDKEFNLDENNGEDENEEMTTSSTANAAQNGNVTADKAWPPFRIMYAPAGSSSPISLPENDDPIPFPANGNDNYRNYQQVTFFWKDGKTKMFNQYKGADLIEREIAVQLRRKVHLYETLEWFTTKEQLGEQDLWYCPECKKHERATKQLDLWKLPDILILHLKRFQYTRWSREKLTWDVEIPVKGLDLTNIVANEKHEKAIYDLIAVSRHYGSMSGGHYTASGFNDKIKKWIDFNDACASITIGPNDPYESSDPYMLVYRRRRLDANGQPIQDVYSDESYKCRLPSKRSHEQSAADSIDENMEMDED